MVHADGLVLGDEEAETVTVDNGYAGERATRRPGWDQRRTAVTGT